MRPNYTRDMCRNILSTGPGIDNDLIEYILGYHTTELLAAGTTDGTVPIWDASDGKLLLRLDFAQPVTAVKFSPGIKDLLVSGCVNGSIYLTNLRHVQWYTPFDVHLQTQLQSSDCRITGLSFNRDGSMFASSSEVQYYSLWDTGCGMEIQRRTSFQASSSIVNTVSFYPSSPTVLAIAESCGNIKILDTRSNYVTQTMTSVIGETSLSVDIHCNGHTIVSSGQSIRLWDTRMGKVYCQLQDGEGVVIECVKFSPDGRFIAATHSQSCSCSVKLYDTHNDHKITELLSPHCDNTCALDFSKDGYMIASGGWNERVSLWTVPWEPLETTNFKQQSMGITSLAFSGHIV